MAALDIGFLSDSSDFISKFLSPRISLYFLDFHMRVASALDQNSTYAQWQGMVDRIHTHSCTRPERCPHPDVWNVWICYKAEGNKGCRWN